MPSSKRRYVWDAPKNRKFVEDSSIRCPFFEKSLDFEYIYTSKIHFFQAVRRIFVALVVEKYCLSNITLIPAPTAFIYVPMGRKKVPALAMVTSPKSRKKTQQKVNYLKL